MKNISISDDDMSVDFRFIGELGAVRLDRSTEITTRLDNLDAARAMERSDEAVRLVEDDELFKATLVHEIQHAIQNIEGFASGGNTRMIEKGPNFCFVQHARRRT